MNSAIEDYDKRYAIIRNWFILVKLIVAMNLYRILKEHDECTSEAANIPINREEYSAIKTIAVQTEYVTIC